MAAMKMIIKILVLIALYILIGSILPFIRQPEITDKTKGNFSVEHFYGADGASVPERAYIMPNNGEALRERLRLISLAEDRIIISTYKFKADLSGRAILAALQAAADRGVKIKILIDGIGVPALAAHNSYFYALLNHDNVEIKLYNPISLLRPWSINGRLHDKYFIVDDNVYTLGGRNIESRFMGYKTNTPSLDWEVLVYNDKAGEGSSMQQILTYFDQIWHLPQTRPMTKNKLMLNRQSVFEAGEELEAFYAEIQYDYPSWFEPIDYYRITQPTKNIHLITNPITPYAKEPVAFYEITQLMQKAKQEVRFHTPYLIANKWMMQELGKIAKNVPQVTMMTNSVANNANLFGAMDYLHNKNRILATGINILEYDQGDSYHGKVFIVDNRLTAVGSFNWDMRSAYINTELMLVIDSEGVNQDMRQLMSVHYEDKSLPVLDEKNYILPENAQPQELSRVKKILMRITWVFARVLRFLM